MAREEKPQHGSDAGGPSVFVVLSAINLVILEVFALAPTLLQEHALQGADVGQGATAFLGADVEPDFLAGLLA